MEQLGRLSNLKHKTKTIYPKKIINNHFPQKNVLYICYAPRQMLKSLKFFIPSYTLRMTIINGKTKKKFLFLWMATG